MGGVKAAAIAKWEDQESRWGYVAEKNGYRCERCGCIPPYAERETYFETGYCSWCAYQIAKDD
jgi:hypothetical protein